MPYLRASGGPKWNDEPGRMATSGINLANRRLIKSAGTKNLVTSCSGSYCPGILLFTLFHHALPEISQAGIALKPQADPISGGTPHDPSHPSTAIDRRSQDHRLRGGGSALRILAAWGWPPKIRGQSLTTRLEGLISHATRGISGAAVSSEGTSVPAKHLAAITPMFSVLTRIK